MTLWSNSSWHLYSRCPRAYGYRYQDGLAPREPAECLTAGTAWHDVSRAVLRHEDAPESGMLAHWRDHNLTRYPEGAFLFHEVPYYLTWSGVLTGPRKKGLIGVIDTLAFTGDCYWIIERKTAAQLRGWHYYRATTQYWSYVAVASEITRLTGLPCRIAYDEVRKAEPKDPQGLICRKCKGANPACPLCHGTNVTGISKAVTETTPERVLAWLDRYPHLEHTQEVYEFIAKINENGDRFNAWYEDTAEDREYTRIRMKHLLHLMQTTRVRPEPNYHDCGRCEYLELCWHENMILFKRSPAEWSMGVHSESVAEIIGVKKNARKH